MGALARFGASLDSKLLERFDEHIRRHGYTNRSEALRDLIREKLTEEDWRAGPREAVAVVSLVYDHRELDLPRRLTDAQHDRHGVVVSTLHVHLSHHSCLEILVLRGRGDEIKGLGERLVGLRGVKHGRLTLSATGRELRL